MTGSIQLKNNKAFEYYQIWGLKSQAKIFSLKLFALMEGNILFHLSSASLPLCLIQ